MENNEQNEIELSKVFYSLLKKWWVILISMVLAAVIGVGFAYVRYNGKNYYGTTVEYDVSVNTIIDGESQSGTNFSYTEKHMARMISWLNSDSFMESVMAHIDGAPTKAENEEAFFAYNRALRGCVRFSYDEDNLNALYVSVSVLNNEAFAKKLLAALKEEVPVMVEEHMIVPSPTTTTVYETVVEELSLSRCELLNGGQMGVQMKKYAVILAAGAFLVACVAIIAIDIMDKRLRGPEKFSARTGLTLLATIPHFTDDANEEGKKQ